MKRIVVLAIVLLSAVLLLGRFLQHTGGRGHFPFELGAAMLGKCPLIEDSKDLYVAQVVDGDTIELSNGEHVRYIGIDTPELRKKDGAEWVYSPEPFAEKARAFNQKLVEGKKVRLEFDVQKRDTYNRLLAYVHVEDTMVNLEMVSEGYAMISTYPPNVKYVEEFLNAQRQSRENNRGFWADLEGNIISASEAKENIGLVRMVEAEVLDTYLSDKVLILKCKDNFKLVIFRNNLAYFPKEALRAPDTYFKYKAIRVYGVIKDYKGASEIIVNDPSQLEILE